MEIVNRDRKEISIDCKFVPKPWLEFEFEPVVLKPGLIANCGFNFKPQQARQYSEVVEFIVNGLSSYKIELTGLGQSSNVSTFDQNLNFIFLIKLSIYGETF